MTIRVGVCVLPEWRRADAVRIWRRCEELGFSHGWTYDHVAWRSLRDSTWFDAVPTLTLAATVTSTMRLGTLVASPNFRHPVVFARSVMALDDISGGRFVLGVGAGGIGWDSTVFGGSVLPLRDRADRFEEFVSLLDSLLVSSPTTFEGSWFSAVDAPSVPGCVQSPRVPFVVAAQGPRGLRLAARYGSGWVTTGPSEAAVVEQAERLDDVGGRGLDRYVLLGGELDPGLGSVEQFRDTLGRWEERGFTDVVVHWPRAGEPYAGDEASFERIVSTVV